MKQFLLGLTLLAGIAVSQSASPLPSGATLISSKNISGFLEQDLWYKSGSLKIRGRLFLPKGTARVAGIVYNHGGITGLSNLAARRCRELALAGFAVFASSYRGEDGSDGKVEVAKGEVDDVLAGYAWFKTHPRVDPKRIAQFGTSHGALIGLLGSARDSSFRTLVFAYGVADIVAWYEHLVKSQQLGKDQLTKDTYGNGPTDRPQSFAIRMGLTAASKISSQMPVLIVQGGKDLIVPPEQALALQAALEQNGKTSTLNIYPNSEHGFVITQETAAKKSTIAGLEAKQAWTDIKKFLLEHTK